MSANDGVTEFSIARERFRHVVVGDAAVDEGARGEGEEEVPYHPSLSWATG